MDDMKVLGYVSKSKIWDKNRNQYWMTLIDGGQIQYDEVQHERYRKYVDKIMWGDDYFIGWLYPAL